MAGNWKDRFGTDTFNHKGKVVAKGDLKLLTAAQRARVQSKERKQQGDEPAVTSSRRRLLRRRAAK